MLNIYDDALIRFFGRLKYGGSIIPTVFAGPDRAHSQVAQWMEDNRGLKFSMAQGQRALPQPFIAVWRSRFTDFTELRNPALYRHFYTDEENGYGLAMMKPAPKKAQVDVNFYCGNQTQEEHIEMQIHATLFPQVVSHITVDFDDPRWYKSPNEGFEYAKVLGQQKIQIRKESLVDNSSIEDSGMNQRELRMTLTCSLLAWIPFQPYAVPLARSIEYVVKEEVSQEELVVVVSGS